MATLSIPEVIPAPPANVAEPVVVRRSSGIQPNNFPLRTSAASDGSNRFKAEITRDLCPTHPAKLPVGQWADVTATVLGQTGQQTLYINSESAAVQ